MVDYVDYLLIMQNNESVLNVFMRTLDNPFLLKGLGRELEFFWMTSGGI